MQSVDSATRRQSALRLVVAALAWLGFPRLKHRYELRAAWGMPGDKTGWLASKYFDLSRTAATAAVVNDKTWADLEFPSLFLQLDTTITPAGRQYLFRQLRTFDFDPTRLAQRHQLYDRLRTDAPVREEIQLTLTPLDREATAQLAGVLLGPPVEPLKYEALIVPWALLSVLIVAGATIHLVPIPICGALLLFNALFAWNRHPQLNVKAEGMSGCPRLLGVAARLASIRGSDGLAALPRLAGASQMHGSLRSQMRLLAWLDRLRDITFMGGLIVLLSACFLLRLAVYAHSVRKFMRHRPQWLTVFDLVGEADASLAVANFLQRHPRHCRPVVATERVISFRNGYHPLLAAPVPNSIALVNRSALVTGSNMAGKTTFIKMVGMNIILGHTLGICLADEATIPHSGVMALIRGDQSVESGKSRYFAEVEVIRDFVDQASSGATRVFILDEPFSGTNTIERLGAARAVLHAIAANAQVLVTTHDVELQHLLGSGFELFHFQEDPAVEGFFDYRLRTGAGTQRNAIKVLERLGFPPEIIAAALATIERQAT